MPKPIQEILPPVRRKGGVHTYTPEIGEAIVAHIEQGGTLKAILTELRVPRQTLHDWLQTVDGLADTLARARVAASFAFIDEILETAREPPKETPEGERHRATKIQALTWLATKVNPRAFGDRMQVDSRSVVIDAKGDAASQAAAHLDRIGQNEAVRALVDLASQRKEQS